MRKELTSLALGVLLLASCGLSACGDNGKDSVPGSDSNTAGSGSSVTTGTYFQEKQMFYLDLTMPTPIGRLDKLCHPGTLTFETDGKVKMDVTFTDTAYTLMDTMLGFRIPDFVHNDTYELNEARTVLTYHPTRDSFEGEDVIMDIEKLSDGSMRFEFDVSKAIPDTILTFYSNEEMLPPLEEPEPDVYKVSYIVAGDELKGKTENSVLPEEKEFQEETDITLPELDFTNGNTIFRGWAVDGEIFEPDGKYIYQPGETYTVDRGVTFTAVWGDTVTVTFAPGENAEGTGYVAEIPYNGAIMMPDNFFAGTDDSKGFAYWSVEGKTSKYYPGSKLSYLKTDAVITPVWNEYQTVTFVPGAEGAGETFKVTAPKDSKITLPACLEYGYSYGGEGEKGFAGWLEPTQKETAGGKKPGTSYTVKGDVELRAKWDVFYTLTFDGDGGTGEIAARKVVKSMYFALPENPYVKEGFAFKGWKVGTSSSERAPGYRTYVSANTTIKPIWKTIRSVSFDTGIAGKTIDPMTQGETMTIVLPEMTFQNGTMTFDGWTDGEKIYAAGSVYEVPENGNTQLTAVWLDTITVKFSGGAGATGSVDSVSGLETKEITLPQNGFKAEGKVFVGWTDGKTNYKAGEKFVIPATEGKEFTLTAVWAEGTPMASYEMVFRTINARVGKNQKEEDLNLSAFLSMTELVLRPDLSADFLVTLKPDKDIEANAKLLGISLDKLHAQEVEWRNIPYTYDAAKSTVTLMPTGKEPVVLTLTKTAKNAEAGVLCNRVSFAWDFEIGEVKKMSFNAFDGQPAYLEAQKVFTADTSYGKATLTVNTDGTGSLKVSFFTLTFYHYFSTDYSTVIWLGDSGEYVEASVGTTEDGKMTITVSMLGQSVTITEVTK